MHPVRGSTPAKPLTMCYGSAKSRRRPNIGLQPTAADAILEPPRLTALVRRTPRTGLNVALARAGARALIGAMCSPVVRSRCARTSAATSWRRCFAGRSGGASRSQPDAEPPAAFQQRRAVDAGIGAAAPRTTVPGVSAAAALYSPAGRAAATGWVQSRLVLLLTWLGSHGSVGTAPLLGEIRPTRLLRAGRLPKLGRATV